MGSSSGTALGIIGIIIAAGAIGFAFFVWNGQSTTNSELDDLTDELYDLTNELNNVTGSSNSTEIDNLTAEFNNLTTEFNSLTAEFNNLTVEFNNLTRNKVVGVWDGLETNRDYSGYDQPGYWLFNFTDNDYNNTDYISVSNTNTRITLLKPGWYRIHLSAYLNSLDPDTHYYIGLLKDHALKEYLYSLHTALGANALHHIDSTGFVYSDGTNYIEIRATGPPPDTFGISTNFNENGFSIEFVPT